MKGDKATDWLRSSPRKANGKKHTFQIRAEGFDCDDADRRVAQAAARWADPTPTTSPTLKRLYQALAHRERVYRKAGRKP